MMELSSLLTSIFSPKRIREQSNKIFEMTLEGKTHFHYREENWPHCVDLIEETIKENYPDLKIPFHARLVHFKAGGIDRLESQKKNIPQNDPVEMARCLFDLVITSVLLDAGAGPKWQYRDDLHEGKLYSRSEGLGVASFNMFFQGGLSHQKKPEATATKLKNLTQEELKSAFQVTSENPLLGVEGRLTLLKNLGETLEQNPEVFGEENPRPGHMVDALKKKHGQSLKASELLFMVLTSLGGIWPGRLEREDINLGDVWHYPPLGPAESWEALVPFHKLSQWLTYSLIEPLEMSGMKVTDIDELTGLPEYRNGGLFIDTGVLELKNPGLAAAEHHPESELIIEWRALTIKLLDLAADKVRAKLNLDQQEFPLVKILEGGTWWAGRRIAKKKRPSGEPPLKLNSDGTVF